MDESGMGLVGAGIVVLVVTCIVRPWRYGAIGKAVPPAMLIASAVVATAAGHLLVALVLAVVALFIVISIVMGHIDRAGLD